MADTIVTATAAVKSAAQGKTTIVDVRSPGEWRQTGIAKGAATVTIHNPNGVKAFVREMTKAVGGDKSKPIALICAAGVRSARALRILAANGFTNLRDIPRVCSAVLRRDPAGSSAAFQFLPPNFHSGVIT